MAQLYKLEAKFGQVGIGDRTASVSASVPIGEISLTKAYNDICEARLTGSIIAKGSPEDDSQQGALPGMDDDTTIKGTFDVAGISLNSKHYGITLSFKLKDIEVAEFAKVAKRSGYIVITKTEDVPEEPKPPKKKKPDGEEEDEDNE